MKNKKYLLISSIIVMLVVLAGAISTTYAWFLSRYSSEYMFTIEAGSNVVIKHESEISFTSGTIDSLDNVMVPAIAKFNGNAMSAASDISTPLDVFDESCVSLIANAVKFNANGAYWTGNIDEVGVLAPTVSATVSGGSSDAVATGDVSYIFIFDYLGEKILHYNGSYYIRSGMGETFTLPEEVEPSSALRTWHKLTSATSVTIDTDDIQYFDGENINLAPNTEFGYTLYLFFARTDVLLDPAFNGQTLEVTVTLSVPAPTPAA